MVALFEWLKQKRLTPNRMNAVLSKWDSTQIGDFIHEWNEQMGMKESSKKEFSFVANNSLSGTSIPCSSLSCRQKRVSHLAEFAALYADKVWISDLFFDALLTPVQEDSIRQFLSDNLAILWYLQPLFEEGLVGIADSPFHFCPSCYEKFVGRTIHGKRIAEAKKTYSDFFLQKAEVFIQIEEGTPTMKIKSPEGYLDGYGHFASIPLKRVYPLLKQHLSEKPYRLTRGDLARTGFLKAYTDMSFMNDFATQEYLSDKLDANYLTDRQVDLDVISEIGDSEANLRNRALMDGLSHLVPYVHEPNLAKLVKLRAKETEAFKVYRDSLTQAIKSTNDTDPKKVREAFNDIVRPELNKIDWTIKNSRMLFADALKNELIVGAGRITVALFGGLLSPDIGKIVAALGGLDTAISLGLKVASLRKEPLQARDNKYYFLWKVTKQTFKKK